MKTITYNPETHKLVPLKATEGMMDAVCSIIVEVDQGGEQTLWPSEYLAIYRAMLNAAPAAEEEPQQPATQGEPVYAFRRKGLDDFCTCTEKRYNELKAKSNLFEVAIFYTSPQPTPELVQATLQALEALDTCDAAHPSDGGQQWYDSKAVDAAITALQNALKGQS